MKTILKFQNIIRSDYDALPIEKRNAGDIRYLIIEPDGTFTESIAGVEIYNTKVTQASSEELGGIRADEKTADHTEAVGIDPSTGKLYSKVSVGPQGQDGKSSYVHVKFKSKNDDDNMTDVPDELTTHLGLLVNDNPIPSNNPDDYTWIKTRGSDGKEGPQGPKGEDGKDGTDATVTTEKVKEVLGITGKEVATKDDLAKLLTYKGSKPTLNDLPKTGNNIGDVWNVSDTGKNYAWDGSAWDDLGGTIDLTGYAKETWVNSQGFLKNADLNPINTQLQNKVDKEAGKGLSSNDFTNALKTKLDSVETGAQKNTVFSVNSKTGTVVLNAADVGARPSTWTPSVTDIPGLPASKIISGVLSADRIPNLNINKITDLQLQLDSKALKSHTHTLSQITGLTSELDKKMDKDAVIDGNINTIRVKRLADPYHLQEGEIFLGDIEIPNFVGIKTKDDVIELAPLKFYMKQWDTRVIHALFKQPLLGANKFIEFDENFDIEFGDSILDGGVDLSAITKVNIIEFLMGWVDSFEVNPADAVFVLSEILCHFQIPTSTSYIKLKNIIYKDPIKELIDTIFSVFMAGIVSGSTGSLGSGTIFALNGKLMFHGSTECNGMLYDLKVEFDVNAGTIEVYVTPSKTYLLEKWDASIPGSAGIFTSNFMRSKFFPEVFKNFRKINKTIGNEKGLPVISKNGNDVIITNAMAYVEESNTNDYFTNGVETLAGLKKLQKDLAASSRTFVSNLSGSTLTIYSGDTSQPLLLNVENDDILRLRVRKDIYTKDTVGYKYTESFLLELSSNSFSWKPFLVGNDSLQTIMDKLNTIETGAQKNTVDSVNNKTGKVTLTAADVGARPSTWTPAVADIPNLPTTKITSGRFIKDRLPSDTVYANDLTPLAEKTWVDGTFVKLSGDETISGIKTFLNSLILPGRNNSIQLGNKNNWFWTEFTGENWTFHNTYTGGGWARNLMEMKNAEGAAYFRIGAQGGGQDFSHMYIGPAYNKYWMSFNDSRVLINNTLNMNNNGITNVSDPTSAQDATNKRWVENYVKNFEYTLPQATSTTLGGVKAINKTTSHTEEVAIDATTGKLYSKVSVGPQGPKGDKGDPGIQGPAGKDGTDATVTTAKVKEVLGITGKEVATKDDLSKVLTYKGSKDKLADLPKTGNNIGDVWNVLDTGKNYAWDGTSWDDLGGTIDLTGYAKESWVNSQGFLKSSALNGYATESWVTSSLTPINNALNNKVDIVSGKGLSANDFTNILKNKLVGIEDNAQRNTVFSVNGKTGAVVLNAADVGARPSTWTPAVTDIPGLPASKITSGTLSKTRLPEDIVFESGLDTRLEGYLEYISETKDLDTLPATKAFIYGRPSNGGWGGGDASTSKPPGSSNGVGILQLPTHSGGFRTQLALETSKNNLWIRSSTGSSFTDWELFAKESWVNSQGFLKDSALNGYAKEAWVNSQGFLKSSALTYQKIMTELHTKELIEFNNPIKAPEVQTGEMVMRYDSKSKSLKFVFET